MSYISWGNKFANIDFLGTLKRNKYISLSNLFYFYFSQLQFLQLEAG
jgi:hypothetical protein